MKKRYAILSSVAISLFFYITMSNENASLVDLINQELTSTPPASSGKQTFNILDATQYSDPIYPWIGNPVTVLSEQQLLGEGNNINVPPDEFKVKEALFKYKSEKRLILNIPSWQIAFDKEHDVMTKLHVGWYIQVIDWVKEVLPDSDIGILGIPYSPRNFLFSFTEKSINYQRVNDILTPVLDVVDTLYPLFRVFNDEESQLYYVMGVHLYLAKSVGKPVFPVVSHRSTVAGEGFNQLIPVKFIKQQCDFIRKNADGIVWWSAQTDQWDSRWYSAVSKRCFL